MFTFDNGILFVVAPKDLVTVLKNLAELQKNTSNPTLQSMTVQNASGNHQGVGFPGAGHGTVLYFEEPKAQEAPAPAATEEVKDVESVPENPAS